MYKSPLNDIQPDDEDLYSGIEEPDLSILKTYLDGTDFHDKVYFSRSEKSAFIKKWKEKYNVNEGVPIFSTSTIKNKPIQQQEYERLLSKIKDDRNRYDIERHLSLYPSMKDKIKHLETYFANLSINENKEEEKNVIDLTKGKHLDESFLRMFGFLVKTVLERMFGMNSIPVSVKGTPSQVNSFARTLSSEKDYMEKWQKYGLDDAKTWRSKAARDSAINKFERATSLKWPFKDNN